MTVLDKTWFDKIIYGKPEWEIVEIKWYESRLPDYLGGQTYEFKMSTFKHVYNLLQWLEMQNSRGFRITKKSDDGVFKSLFVEPTTNCLNFTECKVCGDYFITKTWHDEITKDDRDHWIAKIHDA